MGVSDFMLIILSVLYCSLQSLLTYGWMKTAKAPVHPTTHLPPISIVIAARNEYLNLSKFLPSILQQHYPQYEIIVVLDRCTDQSAELLASFQVEVPTLNWLEIKATPAGWSPKKWAITCGIQEASFEWIALTDADCWVSPFWLDEIAAHIRPNKEIILGLGFYYRRPTIVNLFIQFETLYTAFQYIGAAGLGYAYMGIGRNLAYKKTLFIEKGGLENVKSLLSGDDDLFVNNYATTENTQPMISPRSISYSTPEETLSEWLTQKFRHLSASGAYTMKSKLLIGLFQLSHLSIYVVFLLSLLFKKDFIATFYIFGARLGISYGLYALFFLHFPIKRLSIIYLLLDPFIFIYNLIIVPLGLIKRPEWK